jgi:hypothetical protein
MDKIFLNLVKYTIGLPIILFLTILFGFILMISIVRKDFIDIEDGLRDLGRILLPY